MKKILTGTLLTSLLVIANITLAASPFGPDFVVPEIEPLEPTSDTTIEDLIIAEIVSGRIIIALDDENTVVKNSVLTATGNVLSNDSVGSGATATLTSSPSSTLGNLIFKSDGTYTYELINNSLAVLALDQGDFITDIFTYSLIGLNGQTSNGQLTIRILGSFITTTDNTEIEVNNRSNQATPLHQGQIVQGHLLSSRDKDWYSIASAGNEIVHIEICPKDSSCFNEKNWVVFVLDGDKLTLEMETKNFPLNLFKENGEVISTSFSNQMYLANEAGFFNDSVIGLIDPCFGDTNALNFAIGEGPATLFVAVVSPLVRETFTIGSNPEEVPCGGGSVVLEEPGPILQEIITLNGEQQIQTIPTTQQFISALYSDDQYALTLTRTGVNPLLFKAPDHATYNPADGSVNISSIRIGDSLYSAGLMMQQNSARSAAENLKLDIMELNPLNSELTGDPYLATYNKATKKVFLPQVVDGSTDKIYSVTLEYQPDTNDALGSLEVLEIVEIK